MPGREAAARDHEHAALARLDRKRHAGERRDVAGLRSGGVDQRAACDVRAIRQRHAGDARAVARDADDLAMEIVRALLARGAAQQAEQRMGVEPALAGAAEGAEPQVRGAQPAEVVGERRLVHQHDVGALGLLHVVVRKQRLLAGLAREQQVAALAEADIGLRTEAFLQGAEERDPELAHADVLRGGELLADRGGRECGRGVRIGRVALDHRDRAREAEVMGEEIGGGGADGGPADDHHVEALGTHTPYLRQDGGMRNAWRLGL